jgi:septum formation protein
MNALSLRDTLSQSVILASGSPRRREILGSLGVPFQVIVPDVDEADHQDLSQPPQAQVIALSRVKSTMIGHLMPEALVIGADTLVAVDGQVLGKPRDEAHAFEMLQALQGKPHSVFSGITVTRGDQLESGVLETRVFFKPLTDKAGAYAIQGYGSLFIGHIEGCYFNVVGMSPYLLNDLMGRFGYSLL